MSSILTRLPQTLKVLRLYDLNVTLLKRSAGHSKWQNIKHIKGAKDAQKAVTFQRIITDMRIAASEGGSSDPASNLQLSHVLERARKVNMPNASVQKVLKSLKEDKTNARTGYFQIKGPGGSIIIVKYMSENIQKTRATMNTVLRKFNSSITDGAAETLFSHKGVINTNIPENVSEDDAIAHAIETGAEEVEKLEDDVFQFTCEPKQLYPVKGKLEKLGYNVLSAETDFIAHRFVELSDDDLITVQKMYDKLESDSDIVKLYDNIA